MKKVVTFLTLFMFLGLTVFAQNLTEAEKDQIDRERVAEEMQDYEPVSMENYSAERGEEYITIGDGTDYGSWPAYYAPWANFYENAHGQQLYLASELGGEPLNITELSWYFERVASAPDNVWQNVSIKLMEVSDSELTDGSYYDVSGATEVYSASSLTGPSETGWFTFDIDDFEYSGDNNLLVDVVWGDNGYWTSTYYRTLKTETGTVRNLFGYADGETPPDYDDSSTEVDNLRITHFVIPSEPTFAIDPETYTFEQEVGILDGEAYHEVDNAEFSVYNEGIGTFNITEEPYFFSGQEGNFNYVGDASFPYPLEGPVGETGDSFDFEVEFAPTTPGESTTLLVITDDLGREVRTFEINGSAYEIPEYDITENAYMIDQDWTVENDFTSAMNFDNFYDDYRLDPTADADVVYHFTVGIDSYVNFNDVTGVSQFSVFAEGDAIEEDNNLYEGGQLGVTAGSYFVVASGSGEYEFTMNIQGQEPEMVVDPESLDLGDVPIGCWHEGGTFEVYNDGGQTITFTGASLSDENGVFELDHRYEFPLTISTETLEFDIFMDADTEGTYEGAFLLTDEETTYIYPISGTAYTPIVGDVICDPIVAGFDGTGHYEDDNSVANPPMRDNYHLEEGYGDVVYKFSYPNDMIIDIALDNSVMDPHMVVFSEEDVLNLTPDQIEPVAEGGQELMDLELWGGTYYVIVAGDDATDADYTLTMDVEDMPAPGDITLLTPEDGAEGIPADATLTWELGDYTNNIDVYVDTQYPPTDKVLNSGEPVESIEVDALAPAQIYFWKVVAHNDNGSTESETWAFTTQLPPPLFVQGEIFDYVNVHLWWNNPYDATFRVSEDFEGGEIPDGWTMTTNAEGSSAGWFVTDEGSSGAFSIPPHTFYAVTNDDANDDDASEDYLIMPAHDFSAWDMASVTFESFYNGDYSMSAFVEISTDGGETFEQVHELEPNDAWTEVTVDLTDYAVEGNTDVHVAFRGNDNGAWSSGWAVDDVVLEFENELGGANRALQGYNIYQNGEQINEELVMEEEYDVMDLAAGDYVFGVSAVYDEGESEITEIETITILGMGGIDGTVTDADSGEGIEGANITITGMWADEALEYNLTTDADGMYSVEVPVLLSGDSYQIEATAGGYAGVVEEDITVDPETFTTVDIVMGDIPLPATEVVAVQDEAESEATVTWVTPGEGGELVELSQHDNSPENGYFQSFDMGYGVVFDLSEYTDARLEYVDFHHASWGVTGTWDYKLHIVNWETYEVIAELGPFQTTGNDVWETDIPLGTITGEGGNQVGVFMEPMGNTADDAYPDLSSDNTGPAGVSVFGDIGDWENFGPSTIGDFLMDLWITTSMTDEPVQASKVEVPQGNQIAEPRIETQAAPVGDMITINQNANVRNNSRVLQNFEVWRMMEGQEDTPADWTLLADDVTGNEYVDTEWADLDMGVYRYAVKAIYTVTESDPALSNILGRDMTANTLVMTELNTGDVPEGVNVLLENLDYPDSVYQATTDATGQVQFPELWKGEYLLTVTKEGYEPIMETHNIMESFYIIDVLLKEALVSPVNLQASVDCKDVYLEWEEGVFTGGDEEWTEDFNEEFPPEGWMMETNSAVGWFQTTDGSSGFWDIPAHDSPYACSNDDEANDDGSMDYLITPMQSFAGFASGTLTFESFFDAAYGQSAYVELTTDGGDTWEVIHEVSAADSWQEISIDLADYLTNDYAEVWIGFHSDDNGGWASGWAIDNVHLMLSSTSQRDGDRELLGFNVHRNGEMITSAPVTETNYTDENVPGGTHEYAITAEFTTGVSDPSETVEVEVEMINPAEDLTAERQAWDNVFLEWAPPSDQAIYTLQYDNGENYTAIGTDEAFDFAVASRWYPDQLDTYDGMYLTEISFFPAEEASEYYIRVWTGSDATLVADQLVVEPNIGEWNTVELDTPVQIDASEEFWFGYRANAEAGFPAGCDAGPAVAGQGDMLMDPEAGWVVMSEAYGLDYNWNLAGTVTGGDGEQAQLTQLEETITPVDNRALISQGEVNNNATPLNLENRALDGYNIYKTMNDGDVVTVAENWGQEFYIDYDVSQTFPEPFPEEGVNLTYWVVAQYESGCEPAPSNTAEAFYGVSNENNISGEIKVYPNPAKEEVTIELTDNIDNVRVVNYVGQEVYSKRITSEDVLQIDHLNSGSYVVRLTTNSGETLIKRFVVVK